MILNEDLVSPCLGAIEIQETGDAHEDKGADAAKEENGSFLTGRCQTGKLTPRALNLS